MTRRRFIYFNGEPYEVTLDHQQPVARHDEVLWNDRSYTNLKATDGTPIDSRAKHREYMRANGLTTMDDFKDTWQGAEKQREAVFKGQDPHRRREVERAIYEVQNGRGRRG